MEFRERAKLTKAIQWNGRNDDEIAAMTGTKVRRRTNPEALEVHHKETDVYEHPVTKLPEQRAPSVVMEGSWVLQMASGHIGVMSDAEFKTTYEGEDKRVGPAELETESKGSKKIMALLEKLSVRIEELSGTVKAQSDRMLDLERRIDSVDLGATKAESDDPVHDANP